MLANKKDTSKSGSVFSSVHRYSQKSNIDKNHWYTGRDSNPQPSEPESDALSIEPPVHMPLQPKHYIRVSQFCKGVKFKK